MTFANVGTLGTVPGKRDELVAHLTRRSDALKGIGCLAYEAFAEARPLLSGEFGGFRFDVIGSPLVD